MKNVSRFFAITIFLLSSIAFAAENALQSTSLVEKSYEAKKIKKLVQAALVAQKSSVAKRATVGVLREIVRIGGFELLWRYHWNKANVFYVVLASLLCVPPLFADCFIGRLGASKDKSLDALQKLETYVSTLTSEQKQEISELFEQKYAPLLDDKILQEQDSKSMQLARLAAMLIDLCWILKRVGPEAKLSCKTFFQVVDLRLAYVDGYDMYGNPVRIPEKYDDGEFVFEPMSPLSCINKVTTISLLILILLDSWQIISNFRHSSDRQKACILKKILKSFQ